MSDAQTLLFLVEGLIFPELKEAFDEMQETGIDSTDVIMKKRGDRILVEVPLKKWKASLKAVGTEDVTDYALELQATLTTWFERKVTVKQVKT